MPQITNKRVRTRMQYLINLKYIGNADPKNPNYSFLLQSGIFSVSKVFPQHSQYLSALILSFSLLVAIYVDFFNFKISRNNYPMDFRLCHNIFIALDFYNVKELKINIKLILSWNVLDSFALFSLFNALW